MRAGLVCSQFISDYNGEDHFFTRIGHGGLINLDKVYRTQAVMDRIASFHQHYHARSRDAPRDHLSIHTSSIERGYLVDDTEDRHYALELDTYRPVQPLAHDHGVSFFPISAPSSGIDHHVLQVSLCSVQLVSGKVPHPSNGDSSC